MPTTLEKKPSENINEHEWQRVSRYIYPTTILKGNNNRKGQEEKKSSAAEMM